MTKTISIEARIREMPSKTNDRLYKVVLWWVQGGSELIDDNRGKGYPLYKAEQVFAMLQKTCVGEYEIPTKVAR
jgi:hypothetical protein